MFIGGWLAPSEMKIGHFGGKNKAFPHPFLSEITEDILVPKVKDLTYLYRN